MKKAHLVDSSYGQSLHEKSDKFADKALFFGVTLWMCHLIGIQAGTVVVLGLEFNIKYPFLIYGILGLAVLNYCVQSLGTAIEGFALIDIGVDKNVSRMFLKISKSILGESSAIKSQKRLARLWIVFLNSIQVPWALIYLIILVASFFLALLDVALMIYGFYLHPPSQLLHIPSR